LQANLRASLVELMKDYALGFPPLNRTLALCVMEQTRIYSALKGVRGRAAVDLTRLERLFVQFSLLAAGQWRIKEIDINPPLVSANQMLALDARIVLHDPEVGERKSAATRDSSLPARVCKYLATQG
jgi:acetyltransferase